MLGEVVSFLFLLFIFSTAHSTVLAQLSSITRELGEAGVQLHDVVHFSATSKLDISRKGSLPTYTFLNDDTSEVWHLKVSRHPISQNTGSKETTSTQLTAKSHRKPAKELLTNKELKQLGGSLGVLVHLPNLDAFDPIVYEDKTYSPIASLTLSGSKAIVNLTIYDMEIQKNISRKSWISKIKKFMTID
ncbi:hypothetical protein [Sphingobacterium bambusae]|uniref:Uncharacterized protein n=1 Tax=Sphingobacterium bambusae TaxID=662858 RepID=A0ABW6BGI3_9SPHI|nr:hypothetical protein [Sphingobacterium bambusae]WPL49588.1 hypothetical protein SCB77_03870 [Sphingobacterium bambusae]